MKVKAKVNPNHLKYMKKICAEALVETADALKSDLQQSQTIPFDTGNLQNRSMFIDDSKKNKGVVTICYDAPYARYQYYGISRFTGKPLNYQKGHNKYAGSFWFQPYIDGKKKKFATKAFNDILKGKMK